MTVDTFYNSDKHPQELHQHLFGDGFVGQLDFWSGAELLDFGSMLGLSKGTRLLDVGAGWAGPACLFAGSFGCHVTGVEFSETNWRHARERVRAQGLNQRVELVHGCVLKQNFAEASFDHAIAIDSVVHVPDLAGLMTRLARWVRPGGRLLIATEAVPAECPALLVAERERLGAVRCATRAQYRDRIEHAGFDLLEVRDYPGLREDIASRALAWMREQDQQSGAPSMDALRRIASEGGAHEVVFVASRRAS